MAGLIGLTSSDIELQDHLGLVRFDFEGGWIPHPVVRLTTTLPVVVRRPEGRVAVRARWGFDVGGGRPVGNARDDKLPTSSLWGSMLGKSHCVVAATAVYEQAEVGGRKTSLWFRRVDGQPMLMPGLLGERGMGTDGSKRLCCAIVTTQPNAFFGQFHDRQVCSLAMGDVDTWLTADRDEAIQMLHAPGVEDWEAVPVDDRIFKPGRREMEDLVPIGKPWRWGDKLPESTPETPQAATGPAQEAKPRSGGTGKAGDQAKGPRQQRLV